MKKARYAIVIEKAENNYAAYVPEVTDEKLPRM